MGIAISLYDILEVDVSANEEELERAYHAARVDERPDGSFIVWAYELLRDPARRREYDRQSGVANVPIAPLTCSRCGVESPYLRFAQFFYVWSVIVFSVARAVQGVFCPPCRSRYSMRSALFSAAFGMWGFPWGIIRTCNALLVATRGGKQPHRENARVLRYQGIYFLRTGAFDEALTNLQALATIETSRELDALLRATCFAGRSTLPPVPHFVGQTVAIAAFAVPLLAVSLLVNLLVFVLIR